MALPVNGTKDVPLSSERQQYITRVPSAALLTHDISEAMMTSAASRSKMATIRVKPICEKEFVEAFEKRVGSLTEGVVWHAMKSVEEIDCWVILEHTKMSTSEAETTVSTPTGEASKAPVVRQSSGLLPIVAGREVHEFLNDFLLEVQSYLVGPPAISNSRVIVEPSLMPTALDDTAVMMETIKCRAGHQMDFADSCRVFSSNLSGLKVALEVHQDLSPAVSGVLFNVFYHYETMTEYRSMRGSDPWKRWRRTLMSLMDGPSRLRSLRGVLHSRRKAAGMTAGVVETTASTPDREVMSTVPTEDEPPKDHDWSRETDGTAIVKENPLLEPHVEHLRDRFSQYREKRAELSKCTEGGKAGSLLKFASAYEHFGFHRASLPTPGWLYREWIPNAEKVFLMGDFNNWSREAHPMEREDEAKFGHGVWTIHVPDVSGTPQLFHRCKVKIHIHIKDAEPIDRVPAWTPLAWKSPDTGLFDAVVWDPKGGEKYIFKNQRPRKPKALKIYEAHVGTATTEMSVGTYVNFRQKVLPRIKCLGYNTLLLIGLQEHAEYESFGFQVTGFFAPTSRCGTPEELKELVDTAHGMGISVIMSIVHSHASLSTLDGINEYDGTQGAFFREGNDGKHPLWDARIFAYEKNEVLRFLLSNLAYFLKEFQVDGFRLEGVTSMLYHHHGIQKEFNNDYSQYFNFDLDAAAVTYIMLANDVVHSILPDHAITIAADNSALPTLCRPLKIGGMGFDYRTGARYANRLIKTLLDNNDTSWSLKWLVSALEERRLEEKTIAFSESADHTVKGRRRLKIAMFAWETLHTHAVGGVAPHVTELAAGLARIGQEVHIFTRSTAAVTQHSVHYGVHYHECTFDLNRDFIVEMNNMCCSFVWNMHEYENYSKEMFQICHAHDWLAAKALCQSKGTGHVCVQTMHSTEYGRCGNTCYEGQSKRIRDIESEACHVSDRVIAVSGVLADELVNLFGTNRAKIRVIYNGINAQNFDGFEDAAPIKAQYGIGAMEPMLLFVGRMVVQKGPDLLIEAIPHVLRFRGDTKFVIVGDGHMLEDIKRRARHLNVEHACRFLGKQGGPALKSLFKACDAVLVPSRNEPFGIVVLEAWSAYKPVVATTCGGPRDFVTPHVDGILVNPEPGSIAWGCCEILKNFDHTRWMGERGRVKAAFSFSWDTIARQTRDVYYEQLGLHDAPHCYADRGDSSLAFRLMGGNMFEHMSVFDTNEAIARGLALHKMFRLLACGLGGESYLNFMGNEFGHSECIDMPRPSNGFNYNLARRQYDLPDNTALKYKHLELFDACTMHWENALSWLESTHQYVVHCDDEEKVVAFERGRCLFVFNFHPDKSYDGYTVGHSIGEPLLLAFDTDASRFGGYGRLDHARDVVPLLSEPAHSRTHSIRVYIPSRTGMVFAPESIVKSASCPVFGMEADDFIAHKKAVMEAAV